MTPTTPTTPTFVSTSNDIVDVGNYRAGFVDKNGSLWIWGDLSDNQTTPQKVLDHVVSVHVDNSATVALKSDGSLWGFGCLYHLGYGSSAILASNPVKIADGIISFSFDAGALAMM